MPSLTELVDAVLLERKDGLIEAEYGDMEDAEEELELLRDIGSGPRRPPRKAPKEPRGDSEERTKEAVAPHGPSPYYDPMYQDEDPLYDTDEENRKKSGEFQQSLRDLRKREKMQKLQSKLQPAEPPQDQEKHESIRVWHPIHGKGTVTYLTESRVSVCWDNLQKRVLGPHTLEREDAKYLERISEVEYLRDSTEKDAPRRLDESLIAIGMGAIPGTMRDTGVDKHGIDELDELTLADLLEADEDDEDKASDDSSDDSSEENEDKSDDYYTNVPSPSQTVLTKQGSQSPDSDGEEDEDTDESGGEPLATVGGAEDAEEHWEERIADDPDDAPKPINFRKPEEGIRGIIDLGVMDYMKDRAYRNDSRKKDSENLSTEDDE